MHGETVETEWCATRPFRVNAGAVHSYIIMEGGKTKYLSEIEAGDKILVVNHKGRGRTVTVGRAKIEKRPLLLIKAKLGNTLIKNIVQNAETIRLVSPEGKAVSVSELKKGDKVMVSLQEGGTHFGKRVKEAIIEK